MNRFRKAMIFAAGIVVALISIYIFNITTVGYLKDDGYIVTGNEVYALLSGSTSLDAKNASNLHAVSYDEKLYRRAGALLVGEDRTKINTAFPMFINGGAAIMFFDDQVSLITNGFTRLNSYQDLYISDGISFNADGQRADPDTFIFAEMKNGLFLNTKSMKVSTVYGETEIPANSVIHFSSESMRYGILHTGAFVVEELDVMYRATLTVDNQEYDYLELLKLLGKYREKTMVASGTPSATATPTPEITPEPVLVPEEAGGADSTPVPESNTPRPQDSDYPEIPPDTVGQDDPDHQTGSDLAPMTPQPAEKPDKPSDTPKPADQPQPSGSDGEAGSGTGEDAGSYGGSDGSSSGGSGGTGSKPVKKPKIMIPEVTCSGFTPWVYTLNSSITIKDPEMRIYKGVRFTVYKEGKVYLRLAFGGGGNITLATLPPNTEFEVEGSFQYTNLSGGRDSVTFFPKKNYKTLPIEGNIHPVDITYDNATAEIYPTQIGINNMSFNLDPTATVENNAIPYIARLDVTLNEEGKNDKTEMMVSAIALKAMKESKPAAWVSPPNLQSNKRYQFAMTIEDRFGNPLPQVDVNHSRGTINTCKLPPQALVRVTDNQVGKVTLEISITNPDAIAFAGNQAFLIIKDTLGNAVPATGTYSNNAPFSMQSIPITPSTTTLTITNLPAGSSYTAEVTGTFDIDNNKGIQNNQLIGKSPFYTVPISSLGFAHYTVEISEVTHTSAKIVAVMNNKTAPELTLLLDKVDIVMNLGNQEVMRYTLTKEALSALDASDVNGNGEIVLIEADLVAKTPRITLKTTDVSHFDNNAWNALMSGADADPAKRNPASIVVSYPPGTLTPAASYTFLLKTAARQGSIESDVTSPSSRYNFRTLKNEPWVAISSFFVTENFVEFYDLRILDENASIIGSKVSARLHTVNSDGSRGAFVSSQYVTIGTSYPLIKFSNLKPQTKYVLIFVADAFNNGFDNSTYKINYELQTKFNFNTTNAVSGSLSLSRLDYDNGGNGNPDELYDSTTATFGKYLGTNNVEVVNANYCYSAYIPVDVTKTYYKGNGANTNNPNTTILFYRADRSFISGKAVNGMVLPADFPTGTAFIRFNAYIAGRWSSAVSFKEYTPNTLGSELFNKTTVTTGSFYNGAAVLSTNASYGVSDYIPVSPGAEYLRQGVGGGAWWITFFDANKKVVALIQDNSYTPALIRAPEKAKYARLDFVNSSLNNVSFRQYGTTPKDNAFSSRLLAQITDANNELKNVQYIVRGYKASISEDPLYQPFGNDYTGTISVDGNGDTQDINNYIQRSVDSSSAYRFELILKLSASREVLLSTLEFTTEGPITILNSSYDLYRIMRNPYGRFLVTADTAYLGNPVLINTSVPFMGVLDFQGHTFNSTDNYLIPSVGTTGVIKNLVLDYTRTFATYGTDRYALVYQNYGRITNLYVNYNTTHVLDYASGVWAGCGLIYYNMTSGVVENFVINLKKHYYMGYWSAAGVRYNHGTVRNGYICSYNGSMIKSVRDYAQANRTYTGGLVAYNSASGRVQNVFSLVDLEVYKETAANTTHTSSGVLVGSSYGTVKNSFVTGDRRIYEPEIAAGLPAAFNTAQSAANGPAVGITAGKYDTRNVYYISENIAYTDPYHSKVGLPALYDPKWYQTVIGSQDQFSIDDLVSQGYFPVVKMSPVMMNHQEYIHLPELTPAATPKIVATTVTKQTETYALADITLENPQLLRIKSVTVHNLACEVISQDLEYNNVYRVKIRLTSPMAFVSKYEINSITYSFYGFDYTVNFGTAQSGRYYINAEFYRSIYTVLDWRNLINGDLTQNYRLKADLDFSSYVYDYMTIGGTRYTFSGKLDGGIYDAEGNLTGYHKISGMIGYSANTNFNYIIYNLSGTLKNLLIDDFLANKKATNQAYVGFVRYANTGSTIDNVHINNLKITGYANLGGLVGQASAATITNCTVRNSTITSFENDISTLNMGSIVGYSSLSSISNCYAYNVNLDASDIFLTGGVGGIVGRIDSANITNCYTYGTIKNSGINTGGIVGQTVDNVEINNCISYMDIAIIGEYAGGLAGRYTRNDGNSNYFVQKNLVLGSIYTRSNDSFYFHRVSGTIISDAMGNVDERQKYNYAYKGQLVNGLIPDPPNLDDAVALLGYTDLTGEPGYTDIIGFDENYDYSRVSSGMLPQLKSTYGKVLPYQVDIPLPLDTTAPIVIEEAKEISMGNYYVQFKVIHENSTIKSVTIDGLNITSKTSVALADGTRYACDATPLAPYDSYMLSVVLETPEGKEVNLQAKISFGQVLFKNIANIADWQDFFGPAGQNMQNAYANVNITGDIDFTAVANPVVNVKVNRITGQVVNGNNPKIKNLTFNTTDLTGALINDIVTTCTNIDFENITWTFARGTTQGNRIALIGMSRKNIENTNFKDTTVNAARAQYMGMVGSAAGNIKNVNLNNVKINSGVTPLACSQSGGLVGNNAAVIKNVSGINLNIIGMDYVGGLVGYTTADGLLEDSDLEDSSISGRNYVGGLEGQSYLERNCMARSLNVQASGNNVGGMSGYAYATFTYNQAEDVFVTATNGTSIGGLVGTMSYGPITNNAAKRVTVTGKTTVGGLLGSGWIRTSTIADSTITGVNNVGGAIGSSGTTSFDDYVYKTTVIGNDSVGGAIGYLSNTQNYYNFVVIDSTITGIAGNGLAGDNVGGLSGNVSTSRFYNSYVRDTVIEGRNNIGGLFGRVLTVQSYNCYAKATVNASGVNAGGIAGYATGSSAGGLVYTKFYDSWFYGDVFAKENYSAGILGLFEEGTVPTLSAHIAPTQMLEVHFYNLLSLGNSRTEIGIYNSAWANKSGGANAGTINNFRLYDGVTLDKAGVITKVGTADLPTGATNAAKLANATDLANPAFYTAAAPGSLGWTNANSWSTGGTILLDLYDVFVSAGTGTTNVQNPAWLRVEDKIENSEILLPDGNYNVIITKEAGPGTFTTQTINGVSFTGKVANITIPGLVAGTYTLRFDVMNGASKYSGKIVNYVVKASTVTADMTLDTGGTSRYFTQPATVSVTPVAAGTYTYQWYRANGTGTGNITIAGATEPSVRIVGRGYYFCRVTSGTRSSDSPLIFMDTTGYMPYVKGAASPYPVLPFQEGYDGGGIPYSVSDGMYEGGIPVPQNASRIMRMLMSFGFFMKAMPEPLPVPIVYASGADTLNIEFGAEIPMNSKDYQPSAAFIVAANGTDIITQAIDNRVFTISYDYETPLTLTVINGKLTETYPIEPDAVRRTVMTWGRDYYYLNDVGVGSSKGQILGSFTHLSNGYAMETGGILHDLKDASIVREATPIALVETKPLFSFQYDGYTIATYHSFTKSSKEDESVTRELQILVKYGSPYTINPDAAVVYDGILLDSYLENELFALLGNDGKIAKLSGDIRCPDDFKNGNIVHMSNTLNSESHYLLVRYKDGSVYGFNYLSGEKLNLSGVTSDMSLAQYLTDFFTPADSVVFPPFSDEYTKMMALKTELTIHPFDAENYNPGNTESDGTTGEKTGIKGDKTTGEFEANPELVNEESYEIDSVTGNASGEEGDMPLEEGTASDEEGTPSGEEGAPIGGDGTTGGTGNETANSGAIADGGKDPVGPETEQARSIEGESENDAQSLQSEKAVPAPEGDQTTGHAVKSSEAPSYEKPRTAHYVVAFNQKTMAYEVFDMNTLLDPQEDTPISENDKLKAAKDPRVQGGIGVTAKSAPASMNVLMIFLLIAITVAALLFITLNRIRPHAGKKD